MLPFKTFLIAIVFFSCKNKQSQENISTGLRPLPDTSYWHKAVTPFDTSSYVIYPKNMQEYYDVPGEFGFIAEGKDYGFNEVSVFMANTMPGGGPPLHTHDMEEVHVVHEGTVKYIIGGKIFTATAPYIVRIPAGQPHAFKNEGNKAIYVSAILPSKTLSYNELGRNPLITDSSLYKVPSKREN